MKILLYTPWFGKLPNYFNTWVKSIKHLEGIVDFAFVTDCNLRNFLPSSEYIQLPENLLVQNITFEQLQVRFKDVFGDNNIPMHAYKLCDYKPVYHKVFPEYLTEEYDYWGYCDIDTVFGDVKKFLENIEYSQYDRIGYLGHFTIYKNTPKISDIYRTVILTDKDPNHRFDYLGTTTYPCHFDEEGMNIICDYLKLKFYKDSLVFNTIEKNSHIHTFACKDICELLTWEKGHTFRYHLDENGEVIKDEQMYIHYGVQKDMPQLEKFGDMFFLTPHGFKNFDPDKVLYYLKKYGRPDTIEESKAKSKEVKHILRKRRIERIKREYNQFGMKGLAKNIWYRLPKLYDVIFKYHNF